MEQVKHTPGPWEIVGSKNSVDIRTPDGLAIAWVIESSLASAAGYRRRTYEQCEVDARLIAAAPELLEALQTLLDAVEGRHVTEGDCNQARSAIAKATS